MDMIYKSINEVENYLKQKGISNARKQAETIMLKRRTITKEELRSFVDVICVVESNKRVEIKKEVINKDTTSIYSNEYFDKFIVFVKESRKLIFENEEAPFHSYNDAILWLKQEESLRDNPEISSKRMTFYEKMESIRNDIKSGIFIGDFSYVDDTLVYGSKEIECKDIDTGKKTVNKCLLSISTEHSSKLTRLRSEVEYLSVLSGFNEQDVLRLLLTDEKPDFIKYTVTKISALKDFIEIRINTSDLTLEDIKTIYNDYRSKINLRRCKSMNNKQIKLFHFAEKYPRENGISDYKYYSLLYKKWNETYPDDPYTSRQGICKAYKGIHEKLNKF